MITLHGFPFSNYYNIVKHVLMHKQIPFVEELTYGGGEEWLAISPLGKIPGLPTRRIFLPTSRAGWVVDAP